MEIPHCCPNPPPYTLTHPGNNKTKTNTIPPAKYVVCKERHEYNMHLLHCAMEDAGINAFGAIFVEVWVLHNDGTKLLWSEGGYWIDLAFWQSLPKAEAIYEASCLDWEVGYCTPGMGLVGTLFEESLAEITGGSWVHWRKIKRWVFVGQCVTFFY